MTIMIDGIRLGVQNDQPVILRADPHISFRILIHGIDQFARHPGIRIIAVPRIMNELIPGRIIPVKPDRRAHPDPLMTIPVYIGDIIAADRTGPAVAMLITPKDTGCLIQDIQPAIYRRHPDAVIRILIQMLDMIIRQTARIAGPVSVVREMASRIHPIQSPILRAYP